MEQLVLFCVVDEKLHLDFLDSNSEFVTVWLVRREIVDQLSVTEEMLHVL